MRYELIQEGDENYSIDSGIAKGGRTEDRHVFVEKGSGKSKGQVVRWGATSFEGSVSPEKLEQWKQWTAGSATGRYMVTKGENESSGKSGLGLDSRGHSRDQDEVRKPREKSKEVRMMREREFEKRASSDKDSNRGGYEEGKTRDSKKRSRRGGVGEKRFRFNSELQNVAEREV